MDDECDVFVDRLKTHGILVFFVTIIEVDFYTNNEKKEACLGLASFVVSD